ncbi:MAG: DUF3099 domain-containing protein [Actinomycetales bacterium]|nr:DUF3099 domain-containing protein [Actinomycetales bacterium]
MQSITSAPAPRSEDLAHRQKVYLIQMGIRVVAFLATVATWGRVPMWLSIVFVVGAVVLPYTAVLFANSPKVTRGSATGVEARQLGAAPPHKNLPGGTT